MNKTSVAGPAAALIDFGYRVKHPLSKLVDEIFGIPESAPASLTGFLNSCYRARRPGFVLIDEWTGFADTKQK